MRLRPTVAAGALLLAFSAAPVAVAQAPNVVEATALLERARQWQSRGRDDLAKESIEKLLRVTPEHPEGLLELGKLQLRANQEAEAGKTLDRLRRAHPNHAATTALGSLLRLRGPDAGKLRQARALARAGRAEEAVKEYRALFPGAFPDDELAVEFASVLAGTPRGFEAARAMLADLAAKNPDSARFKLAYAQLMSTRKPISAETMRTLKSLAGDPALSKPARDAWRAAALRLDEVPESIPMLREYVEHEPGDSAVKERLEIVERAVAEKKRLLADPAYQAKVEGLALLEKGEVEAAEKRLEVAIAKYPKDAELVGGMGLLRLRQGKHAEALELFQAARTADTANRGKWDSLIRTARYWNLMRESREARDASNWTLAEKKLKEARGIDPKEPNAIVDLGRVSAAQGRNAEAERYYEEALSLAPGNASALEALMGLYLRSGREREFEAFSPRLTPAQRADMGKLADEIRSDQLRARAKEQLASGATVEAIATLEQAAAIDRDDPWLRLDLARAYAGRDEVAKGLALFDALLARRPGVPEVHFAAALFQSSVERESEALATLERTKPAERSASMTSLQRRLWVSVQGARATAMAKAGQRAEAKALLAGNVEKVGNDVELLLNIARDYLRIEDVEAAKALVARVEADARPEQRVALAETKLSLAKDEARALRAAHQWDEAVKVYGQILQASAAEKDAELGIVETLVEAGRRDEAKKHVDELLRARLYVDDPDFSASLASALIELGDLPGARPLVDGALAKSPEHPRALGSAAQLAAKENRVDQAVEFLQRSVAADPTATYRYRQLAELRDLTTTWAAGALDYRGRSGSGGKSRLSSAEIPLEWKDGWKGAGRWFARVDPSRVNSGELDLADNFEVRTYGSLLLCQPLCEGLPPPGTDNGVAFSAGFERPDLRVDIGTSPLGFRVTNILGGVVHKGDIGPGSYSIDVSRRPVTGSLLSWAGMFDPNTGKEWGGVVATGARLGLSRDSGGAFGFWSTLGLHRLTGKNVQANKRMQLMAGGYHRVINEEDRVLTVGMTGMYWRHSENAGEYTFGHGGYYSPYRYESLGFPVTFGWRTATDSFAIRGSFSVSWSKTKTAAYYPTDPALQAQAEALTPINFVDPHYIGGDDGRSYGRALGATWERQILPGFFVGARAELERSTNYTPNRFLLYFRMATDRPAARPVAFPPEPVLPSSQY